MRKFKFRCYDKNEGYMLPWEHLMDADDLSEMLKFGHQEDADYSKLMQFTGLKDYHGVEIYEGDILFRQRTYRNKNGTKGKVEFKNSTWMLIDKEGATPLSNIAFNTEILGNIYENPELLEVSTDE